MPRLFPTVLAPLALAALTACVPGYGYGPGPGPGGPVLHPAPPAAAIGFSPAVQPYVYSVRTIDRNRYQVRYLPGHVSDAQILVSFRPYCVSLGTRPFIGPAHRVRGYDRHHRTVTFRVVTVVCR